MTRLEPRMVELPLDERPRERLVAHGSGTLSDAELVAVMLRTGRPGQPVLALARELVAEWGGLTGLTGVNVTDLRRKGIGTAKAACLLAAIELGRRLAEAELPKRDMMNRPSAVARYLALRYCRKEQEVMGALFLDARHRRIGERDFFRGTLARILVEPRVILKEALARGAAGVLLFHTHPSGDPSPSFDDILFTRRMVAAGELVGVQVVDHIVIGSASNWISLKQRGECLAPPPRPQPQEDEEEP